MISGRDLLERADRLAAITEMPPKLTRTYLTPAHRQAAELVLGWMHDAGMAARLDEVGNVAGRYEGTAPGAPCLMLGSHLDTVRDAGKYDGMLGVITAIACIAELNRVGSRLPFAIEVLGFGDEEGVRFGGTLIGSRAVAGTFDRALLDLRDTAGISLAEAYRAFGLDPARIGAVARKSGDVLAYVELHIEQGPRLEREGLAVGVVTAIAGFTRLAVAVTGTAGHAGTVPMEGRRDALAAAAECVLAVERRCRAPGLVGTVGKIEALPGAINVVPGITRFTVDVRAAEDALREQAAADLAAEFRAIAARRGVEIAIDATQQSRAAACAPWIMQQIAAALRAEGQRDFRLMSGAGHDGMALAAIADIGMIFVRCAKGISHNPAEAITADDAEIGARCLLRFIRDFTPRQGLP
ncbi:MAG: allantoate amidohydrolase [Rhodospirillaceae bacterium]|nr:allantoate amidohydrolase [Rhodospirillaceae bacterium]